MRRSVAGLRRERRLVGEPPPHRRRAARRRPRQHRLPRPDPCPTPPVLPLFSGIDLEGNYAYTSYSTGFKIWDISPPTAQRDPQEVSGKDGWQGKFLQWDSGNLEIRERIFDIDVPDGNGNLAAMVGISPLGIAVWNTTSKSSPSQLYQDTGITARDVYTATIGGRSYAFVAAHDGGGVGLQVYDLTSRPGAVQPLLRGPHRGDHVQGGRRPGLQGPHRYRAVGDPRPGLRPHQRQALPATSAQLAPRGVGCGTSATRKRR